MNPEQQSAANDSVPNSPPPAQPQPMAQPVNLPLPAPAGQPSGQAAPDVLPQTAVSPPAVPVAPVQTQSPGTLPQPMPAPNVPQTHGQPAPKRRKSKLGLVVTIILLLLISAGAAGAYAYTVINNSPERVLADALSGTMADVLERKPLRYSGVFTYKSKNEDVPLSITVNMDVKQVNEAGQAEAMVDVSFGEELSLSVNGAYVIQGTEAVYFKIDNLKSAAEQLATTQSDYAFIVEMFMPAIEKIDGIWINADEQSLIDAGMAESEELFDKCSEEFRQLRISKDDQKRVKDIFLRNQFAIATEELPDDVVEGETSYHYKLDLNEQAGLNFAKEFIELESFAGVKQACEMSGEDIDNKLNDVKSQVDQELQARPVFELWVSKQTRRPTKLRVELDDQEISFSNVSVIKVDAPDITVEAPTDFVMIQDIIAEIENLYGLNEGGSTLGLRDIREAIR